MSEFSNSPKWKLVNNFTINEDNELSSGRPFMLTCVPKRLFIDVNAFEIVRNIEWPDDHRTDPRPNHYLDKTRIKFSGKFNDKINVFSMSQGDIAKFDMVTDAEIRPLPPGGIGGTNCATVFDGIGLSGMSSQEVPENGLMEGEPGHLQYFDEWEDVAMRTTVPASLTAYLFLDEDKFNEVTAILENSVRPIRTFKVDITAELFESEMSASLSEAWMPRDYGLLMRGEKGSGAAYTLARVDRIVFSTGPLTLPAFETRRAHGRTTGTDHLISPNNATPLSAPSNDHLLKYQRYILAAILVLIAVTAFSGH